MWTWGQNSGRMMDPDHKVVGMGYSGYGVGQNNGLLQAERNIGPIPLGFWLIDPAQDDPHLGPCVMRLVPSSGTDPLDRSGFYIHGDSRRHPGLASHGCIILGPAVRQLIAQSSDRKLYVVPTL